MKLSSLALAGLAAIVVQLSGCATSATTAYIDNTDYAKAAAIDRAAQRYGVKVYWLNYPQKRQMTTSAAPSGS
jgi:hypothetical protein